MIMPRLRRLLDKYRYYRRGLRLGRREAFAKARDRVRWEWKR